MAKIKSNIQLSWDSANPTKQDTVVIEMTAWNEDSSGNYFADIEYRTQNIDGAQSLIRRKPPILITPEKFNTLYLAAESLIPEGLSPYEKRELRKELSLLIYVQNDFIDEAGTKCVFNTLPSVWVPYNS